VRGDLILPRFPEQALALRSGWERFGFGAQPYRLFGEAFLEAGSLFETTPLLHAALHSLEDGGKHDKAFFSPMDHNDKGYLAIAPPVCSLLDLARGFICKQGGNGKRLAQMEQL
jgi:hypothetical protein